MPDRPDPIDLPTLWALSGQSWLQMESATGLPEVELRRACEAHGFERSRGTSGWERGPCLGCGEPYAAEELDEDFRCEDCGIDRRSTYRWGTQPPEGHRHWIALELIASDHRRDRRLGRLHPHHEDRRQTA